MNKKAFNKIKWGHLSKSIATQFNSIKGTPEVWTQAQFNITYVCPGMWTLL